ncbi:fibrous sheath CABYR-binding protein-like isoform X2 [Mizuhopecten yessoensis]|uniref:fibrous sheath CABYR-binding protein-like isoform X2 n=1 Tax=Mizuhopecten yessoensis TaxID=6573 RepID=UPI000B45E903|nr:fibrous sheath CABYR-binding protein-like isoform X2 [Mizuhopecten yessoensis]
MTRETGGPSRYEGYRLGPDIPWKPYHNKVHEYKPHTYGSTVRPYDRVHEYKKVHEYTRIHEHSYREYTSSYRPKYYEYKLNIQKKPSILVNSPQPPKVVRTSFRKRHGNLYLCYAHPMGPDIRVKEHKYKEYQKGEYQPTYSEYNASTGQYMDTKWTQYNGNVEYVLTPHNHYPLRWGRTEKHNVDENGNDFTKEPTQTSLSKVKPIVYEEEPVVGNEPDAIEEEEPEIAETGLYRDPTIENTPFVEEAEEDFYAAPLVITDQVVTPLPIEDQTDEDPEHPPQEEPPEQPHMNEEQDIVVPVVAVVTTGGHTAPVQEAEDVPQHQPAKQDTAPEESGRWSSLTTHGSEGNADASLTPVEAAVAGAVVGGTQASQPDQPETTNTEIADTLPVSEAPTTGSAVPEAEVAAAPVEVAPVVAAAAVTAESAPSDASTVAADSSRRLPPEQSPVGTVKRTLDMMY